MKYSAWLQEWLSKNVKPRVKQSTYQKYERISEKVLLPDLGALEMEELSPVILQDFAADLSKRYSPNTTLGIVSVLKNSLRRARTSGVVSMEFSNHILLPRMHEKAVECFSALEQKKIETYILSRKKKRLFGILLCFYTGLRVGELLALQWKDVDLKRGTLRVSGTCHDRWGMGGFCKELDSPKTATSARVIPIPYSFLKHLRVYKKECKDRKFVVSGKEKEISIRSYQRSFELLLKRLKLPHRGFHAIRHTFATRALECGMDVKTLSEILGHNNPTVTLKRYAHCLYEHKSAMMNRLGRYLR